MLFHACLIQESLDLYSPSADTVCLIPIDLRLAKAAIGKAHQGDALQLSPAPLTVTSPQKSDISDRATCRDRLDLGYVTNGLKYIHTPSTM